MIVNKNVDELMQLTKMQGLTFDDVTLVTQYADFLPEDTCIKSKFSRNISLNIPFVSAAMDTVTGSSMAIAIARLGGIGVIHKNMDIELHAEAVRKVKLHSNGLIQNPVSFNVSQTVEELLNYKDEKRLPFSGFPILDGNGRVAGILTAKDLKFCNDRRLKLEQVMTKNILTDYISRKFNFLVRYKNMCKWIPPNYPMVTDNIVKQNNVAFMHFVGPVKIPRIKSYFSTKDWTTNNDKQHIMEEIKSERYKYI